MSKIAVLVETDHHDPADAVRSVADAMRRAGYDVPETGQGVGRVLVTPDGWPLSLVMDGHVDASEPDLRPTGEQP